jgi:acyl-coenzyme A synthetase/AMP-(fatty) acid ligase
VLFRSAWFLGGELNASYNCVDRHALANPDKTAIICEADDEKDSYKLTFGELLQQVSKVAGVLKSWGVGKGDTVAIYLPMNAQAIIAMLAVARLGAIHSVIFAGFSSGSIRDRVNDASCKAFITCDEGKRGGRTVNIKKICDEALEQCPTVEKVWFTREPTTQKSLSKMVETSTGTKKLPNSLATYLQYQLTRKTHYSCCILLVLLVLLKVLYIPQPGTFWEQL